MDFCQKALTIEQGYYRIEGARSHDYASTIPFEYDKQLYLNLQNTSGMDLEKLADDLFCNHHVDNFTVILSDRSFKADSDLKLPDRSSYYAWFCVAIPPKPLTQPSALTDGLAVKRTSALTLQEVATLTSAWSRDYVEAVLDGFPDSLRNAQRQNFEGMLKLENAQHSLFSRDGSIVGHLMLFNAFFAPLGKDSTAVHFWVDPSLPRSLRHQIHAHLWHDIQHSFSENPRFAGVAQVNQRSVRYLLENGAYPLHLRVKRILPAGGTR